MGDATITFTDDGNSATVNLFMPSLFVSGKGKVVLTYAQKLAVETFKRLHEGEPMTIKVAVDGNIYRYEEVTGNFILQEVPRV